MPRKVEIGPALAALGALLLLVSLFLEWFGPTTGWGAFELLDLVLAGIAVVALVTAGAALLRGGVPDGWGDTRWLPALGLVALVAVAAQLLEPPPFVEGPRDTGAWVALAGAALLLVGGILEAASISVSVQVREGGAARRRAVAFERPASPADPADEPPTRVPAVDRRPGRAPEPGGGAVRAPDEDLTTQPLPTEERPAP